MVDPGHTRRATEPADLVGEWEPAEWGPRFGALVVDWIMCLLATGILGSPREVPWFPPSLFILVYGFFLGLFGQTPGMWLAKVRCVRFSDGGPIGIPRALLRGTLLMLLVPALIWDNDRRGLHDKAAGSVVVNAPR